MRKKNSMKSVLVSVENYNEYKIDSNFNKIIEIKQYDFFEKKVMVIQKFWRKSKFLNKWD
jgi:hypothetical protein